MQACQMARPRYFPNFAANLAISAHFLRIFALTLTCRYNKHLYTFKL